METFTDQEKKMRDVVTSGTWGVFRQLENVCKWKQFSVGSKGEAKAEENSEYLMFPNSVTRRVYHKKESGRQTFFSGIW